MLERRLVVVDVLIYFVKISCVLVKPQVVRKTKSLLSIKQNDQPQAVNALVTATMRLIRESDQIVDHVISTDQENYLANICI